MEMVLGNLISGLVLLALSTLLYLYLRGQGTDQVGGISPNAWPSILLGGLILCGTLLTLQSILQRSRGRTDAHPQEKSGAGNTRAMVGVIVATVGYIIAFRFLGFLVSTYLFMSITLFILGVREKKKLLLLPLLVVSLLTLGMAKILYIPLPKGMGIFREFTAFVAG
jgi:putative tricarboxylic transport membrane protein